jgi:hypothetical protein
MRVYQQVLDMGGRGSNQLEQMLGCTADEAQGILSRARRLGTDWAPSPGNTFADG